MLALKQIVVNKIVDSIIRNQNYNEKMDIFLPNINYIDKQSHKDITDELKKIHQLVSNKINYRLSIIDDGYEVVYKHIYDTDRYGHIYEVSCKNGFDGLCYEISSAYHKEKNNYYFNIIYKGIRLQNRIYYIHESILLNGTVFIIGFKDIKKKNYFKIL